ncbi:MAG: hypothetical protein AB7F39_06535 [Variibacter sp.]
MASRLQGLSFITDNPAAQAFNEGVAAAQKQRANDLAIEGAMLKNTEALAGAPSRLRRLDADTALAETNADVAGRTADAKVSTAYSGASTAAANARTAGANADVAQGTVGSRIDQSAAAAQAAGANARTAGANADVAQGTVGSRIDQSAAAAQAAGANARTAGANADVAVATVPTRIEEAGTRLRQAKAGAVNTELAPFYKSIELLGKGDIESAKAVAAQAGQTIPDFVLNSAEARSAISNAATYAQKTYPNRPRDQIEFMRGYITDLGERKSQGQPANDPAAVYNVPGAPKPPETSERGYYELLPGSRVNPDTGKSESGTFSLNRYSGQTEFTPGMAVNSRTAAPRDPAKVAAAKYLVEHGVAPDEATAWQMVNTSPDNPNKLRTSVYNTALKATFGDQKKAAQIADDFMAQLQSNQGGVSGPTVAPAAAAPARPAPAARPPAGLQGSGTKAAPYKATTQQQINWFKTTAPAGSVIEVNGQLYSK